MQCLDVLLLVLAIFLDGVRKFCQSLMVVFASADASAEYLEWTQLGRPFRFRLYSRNTELVFQAAYNVGGHTISIDTLQSSILGCQSPRPGQWLRFLSTSKTNLR
ncbi:hypothetical protein V6N12_048232 [Hibiscus sabdariffa]|uniref:Uncharacterized protein n=1 Tax=Hibiscus sabdariffa TaxID=183260 RepID=A0ABR2EGN0_9ROSI